MFEKSGAVRQRVMSVINEKINDAEKKYKERVLEIDEECQADVEAAYAKRDSRIESDLNEVVGSVVGKLM